MDKKHYEKHRERITLLRPIDDTFFEKLAESPEVCQEMLRVFLGDKDLKVLNVVPQKSVKNLQGRSVRLDAHCVLGNEETCNVEVQRASGENHLKRVRYNASCITANITNPGDYFKDVPNVTVVYISETDIFKKNRTAYHVDHVIRETSERIDNGLREIYINAAVDDGSEIAELMQCFLQTDVDNKKFPKFSERVHYFKHDEEGVKIMCAISEEIRNEGIEVGKEKTLIELVKDGLLSIDQGAEKLNVSVEEFEKMMERK